MGASIHQQHFTGLSEQSLLCTKQRKLLLSYLQYFKSPGCAADVIEMAVVTPSQGWCCFLHCDLPAGLCGSVAMVMHRHSPRGLRSDGSSVSVALTRWHSLTTSPGFLSVSPKIFRISSDIVVNEGSNVTLVCLATGKPEPSISWRHISPSGKCLELSLGTSCVSQQ